MNNLGRVLTLRVTIKDPEAAKWLWEAHSEPKHGILITGLSNGDMFQERDTLADAATFYIREEGETTKEAIEAHFNDGFATVEAAASDAPKNVSPGSKWEIIDRHGNVLRKSE